MVDGELRVRLLSSQVHGGSVNAPVYGTV